MTRPAIHPNNHSDCLRAWKQTDAGARTYYLYDGSQPVCELSGSGTVTAQTMFGANGLVSRSTPGGGTVFYAFDERGNVAHRVSSSGSLLSSDLYDTYGKQREGASDVYGFGGQAGYYTEAETGLVLCTNRHYDPQTGRFLTRDPIGYDGGVNLYSYTANNPVNWMDPYGTSVWGIVSATATTAAVVGGVVLIGGAAVVSAPVLLTAIAAGAIVGAVVSHYGDGNEWGPASADGLLGSTIVGDLTPMALNRFGSEMQVRPGTIYGDRHFVYGAGDEFEHAVGRRGMPPPMTIEPMTPAYVRIFKPSKVTLHIPIAFPDKVMNPGGKAMNCATAAGAAARRGILGK